MPAAADPPESYVYIAEDGTVTYVGPLATRLYQAGCLRAALATPLGPFSARKLMTIVRAFTGRPYAPSDRVSAIADLDVWIRGMELIVPVLKEKPNAPQRRRRRSLHEDG